MTMAGDKDDKHHLFEADENLEKALQEPKLNNISEKARALPAHKNTHSLQWLLLTQAGAILLSCLGLCPQKLLLSLIKRHHVYKVKLKQENMEPGQSQTIPGRSLGLTPLEPSRGRFLKENK